MAKRSLQDARVLLTGASSGIGRALALVLARRGARLVLVARRAERLRQVVAQLETQGTRALAVTGDICQEAVRQRALQECQDQLGGLDILINNAGVGAIGPFASASPQRLRQVMDVNFFAAAELIRAGLPLLRQGRNPLIVNVSSVLGHRAVPKKSEYCASKFALHGLSDALRAELAPEKIDVLLVSPTTTKTEFFENVLENEGDLPWLKWGAMSSEAVARQTARAIERGKHEIILSLGGKLLVACDRLLPSLMNRLIAKLG